MNLPRLAGFFLTAVVALTIRASAATFTDEMAAVQNTAETQYFGLKLYTGTSYDLSDQSLAVFSNTSSPLGYALYRVNGAEKITVGIYTLYGTCVSQKESDLVLGQGTMQAGWSRSENAVCSDFGGSFWQIELNNRFIPTFYPISALPRDTVGFGLNIYASPELDRPLPAAVTRSVTESLCYEEYTASVPASAQYIKVEVNDITSYPIKAGGTMPNRIYTLLASVRISGEALVMGEPAKVAQQPSVSLQPPVYEGVEEDEGYGGSFAAKELPEEAESAVIDAAHDEKSGSSKFEGTITSSSRPEKTSSSKPEIQSGTESQKNRRAESASKDESSQHEIVYEVRREKDGGLLNSGVTVYIIVVTGALVLLLILGRKK